MNSLAESFREFARWADDSDPLYAHFSRQIADDSELLGLAETAPEDRQPPNLLLAAVQFLLARSGEHPLADYYPNLTDNPTPIDDDCYPTFRVFCLDNAERLTDLLERRRTQTNSVRRCAVLYPAIAHIANNVTGPLALIELGASAGLNLMFDRYRYEYDRQPVGAADATVTIESDIESGTPPLPETPPAIHSRVGIDLNPLAVTDPDDADWLRALVWPAHTERRALLESSIETAIQDPPRCIEGDMIDRLPTILDGIPSDIPVCVFNTLVLYQVPEAACQELDTILRDRMDHRPLHWLTGQPELSGGESIGLDWVRRENDDISHDRLINCDPHGAWLDWRT
jgi:hypothetical protein